MRLTKQETFERLDELLKLFKKLEVLAERIDLEAENYELSLQSIAA